MIERETNHKGKGKTLKYSLRHMVFFIVKKCLIFTLFNKTFIENISIYQINVLPLHCHLKVKPINIKHMKPNFEIGKYNGKWGVFCNGSRTFAFVGGGKKWCENKVRELNNGK